MSKAGQHTVLRGIFVSFGIQLIALALTVIFREWRLVQQFGESLEFDPFLVAVAIWGILAGVLACITALLPVGWRVANTVLPLGVYLVIAEQLSAPVWFGVGILGLLLFLPTVWSRVPYYPTNAATDQVLVTLLPQDRPFTFVDLGCGFGGVLTALAAHLPRGTFIGVELSPLAWGVAKLRAALFGRGRVQIRFQSLWDFDTRAIDVVYAFLAPPVMPRLGAKIAAEACGEKLFISNSFPLDLPATQMIAEHNGSRVLYLYRITSTTSR